MKKTLVSILGLIIIGLCESNSQSKEFILGDTLVIIERLTSKEADERRVDRIKAAQSDNKVSDYWRPDNFRINDKRLEKDYNRIVASLIKKGVKVKELTRNEFEAHLTFGDTKVVYLTTDYSVTQEKKYLIITTSFKLLRSDKKVLLDESAKGIVKQISGT